MILNYSTPAIFLARYCNGGMIFFANLPDKINSPCTKLMQRERNILHKFINLISNL